MDALPSVGRVTVPLVNTSSTGYGTSLLEKYEYVSVIKKKKQNRCQRERERERERERKEYSRKSRFDFYMIIYILIQNVNF